MSAAVVRRYWSLLAASGCIVHGEGCAPQIAHAIRAPDVQARVQEPKPKGKKLPRHDWLVIPLCPPLHFMFDNNPALFDQRYGLASEYIDQLAARFRVPIWELSQMGRKSWTPTRGT